MGRQGAATALAEDRFWFESRFLRWTLGSGQLDFFYDYRTNVELYPQWQKFLRQRQPKTLVFLGQNDIFFTPEGGESYLNDLPNAELHRLNSGHFAVEDCLPLIVDAMLEYHAKNVAPAPLRAAS